MFLLFQAMILLKSLRRRSATLLIVAVMAFLNSNLLAYAATEPSYDTILSKSKIPFYSQLTSKPSPNRYLLIEPDFSLPAEPINAFETFFNQGGHALVISNSILSSQFGIYFSLAQVENSSLEFLERRAPDPPECTSLSYFPTPKGALLQRFYCLGSNDNLYTVTFASKDLFKNKENFGPFAEAMAFPKAYETPELQDSISSSPYERLWDDVSAFSGWIFLVTFFALAALVGTFLGRRISLQRHPIESLIWFILVLAVFWGIAFLNFYKEGVPLGWWRLWRYPLVFFLIDINLVALFVFLHFVVPSRVRPYWNSVSSFLLSWPGARSPRLRSSLFWIFTISVVLFLYDFFIWQIAVLPFLILVALLGIETFFAIKHAGSYAFSKAGAKVFRVVLLLIFLSPLAVIRLRPPDYQFFSLNAAQGAEGRVSLQAEGAWVLSDTLLLIPSKNFSLQVAPGTSFKEAEIKMRVKGNNARIRTESEGRFYNLFISELEHFAFVDALTAPMSLYRSLNTPRMDLSGKELSNWKKFVHDSLPPDSSLVLALTSEIWDSKEFFVSPLPVNSALPTIDTPLNLSLDPELRFYTHLTGSTQFEFDFDTLENSVRFILKDKADKTISERIFSSLIEETSHFSVSLPKVKPGVYTFHFEPAVATSSVSTTNLEHLRLNSSTLSFSAPNLPAAEQKNFYAPRVAPGHEVDDVFYAPSEAAWFYPFIAKIDTRIHPADDYVIAEDYPMPIALPERWFGVSRRFTFNARQKSIEIPFEFTEESTNDQRPAWLLLDTLDLTLR